MCNLDIYERTKVYKPMFFIGALLSLTACLMISLGIGRARPDVWIAGILVAIVGGPLFIFSTIIFCVLNRPSEYDEYNQGFDISKLNYPAYRGPAFMTNPYGYTNQSQIISNGNNDQYQSKNQIYSPELHDNNSQVPSNIYVNARPNQFPTKPNIYDHDI